MAVSEFLAQIESPRLLNVARHWAAARGSKRLPGWNDLDPLAMAPELPIVWSWKYDRGPDSFTGRLAGEDINNIFGKNLRGAVMKEFFEPRWYDLIFARHKRVVTEPALAHGSGPVFLHAGRHAHGERIILPLAEDGTTGDGLIGATIYPSAAGAGAALEMEAAETVLFFAVD